MEFLKALFENGPLTYEQLVEKAKAAKIEAVNIAGGTYVSRDKFDDKVRTLSGQITDLQGQLKQRDTDMADLQTKLSAAEKDAGKLADAQASLSALQSKYSDDQKAWQTKVDRQQYEFAIREKANGIKFTSPAAKRDFIREATSKEFKADGDTLLGYDDFVTKYKADNPGAVADDAADPAQPDPKMPTIVLPGGTQNGDNKASFGFHFTGVRAKPQD